MKREQFKLPPRCDAGARTKANQHTTTEEIMKQVEINEICDVEPSARPNWWQIVLYDIDGMQMIVHETRDYEEAVAMARRIGLMTQTWIEQD